MKLTISNQHWRLRLKEHELDGLLEGGVLTLECQLSAALSQVFSLRLTHASKAGVELLQNTWQISLPLGEVQALKRRLPSREGCDFELSESGEQLLCITLEVDVRDSLQQRDGKQRAH